MFIILIIWEQTWRGRKQTEAAAVWLEEEEEGGRAQTAASCRQALLYLAGAGMTTHGYQGQIFRTWHTRNRLFTSFQRPVWVIAGRLSYSSASEGVENETLEMGLWLRPYVSV